MMNGLRRSARVRRPIQRYNPKDEEDELLQDAPAPKRRAKAKAKARPAETSSSSDAGDSSESASSASEDEVIEVKAPRKKGTKRADASNTSKPKPKVEETNKTKPKTGARYALTKKPTKLKLGEQETRLKDFVDTPSDKYSTFLKRAGTERMFVLDRVRDIEPNCHALHQDCPRESVQLAGSKGDLYNIKITHVPTCSCPQFIFRRGDGLCKHVLYVLHFVLKVKEPLAYQNAFLTDELREIFQSAPAMATDITDQTGQDDKRKPLEDDCPICCMEFETNGEEETVWCRAACGNNLHKSCFDQWARLKAGNVTCPFCRSKWEFGEAPAKRTKSVNKVDMPSQRGATGYYNVRDQLGYDD